MGFAKRKTRHYAFVEGKIAAAKGFTGVNPHAHVAGRSKAAKLWSEGYACEVQKRLDAGLPPLPEPTKPENPSRNI